LRDHGQRAEPRAAVVPVDRVALDGARAKMSRRPGQRHSTRARVGWLIACLAGAGALGAIGHAATGDAAWYLALPAVLAVGWWFVADPRRCLSGEDAEPGESRPR
jgi:hypothetical protein